MCFNYITLFGKEIDFTAIKRYSAEKIDEAELTGDGIILNRLKSILPEAFYYWQQVEKNQ
ncbi:MAG: hypothetical protein PHY57_03185 [Ignavibacterium sp.]|nr:MAG: hypothetical protein F9K42_03105 [Ignavibacterium sp.]MDD5607492.1 hypothetical protein [Ignavibacterium sp.]MDX9711386.1 hypothetical protein [Ignavibacteriaceae bacterium]